MPIEIEPDPEPEIPSPTHNIPRGPSPEAKPDDTECHRSQSAMYDLCPFNFYSLYEYFSIS